MWVSFFFKSYLFTPYSLFSQGDTHDFLTATLKTVLNQFCYFSESDTSGTDRKFGFRPKHVVVWGIGSKLISNHS